jgi:hypothetical protein
MLDLKPIAAESVSFSLGKRVFDLVFSTLVLLLALPLMLAIALADQLTSKGSVRAYSGYMANCCGERLANSRSTASPQPAVFSLKPGAILPARLQPPLRRSCAVGWLHARAAEFSSADPYCVEVGFEAFAGGKSFGGTGQASETTARDVLYGEAFREIGRGKPVLH